MSKRIAMIATGDEIVNGDIVDTNAPFFAQQFLDRGITPGRRVSVSDDQREIEMAIRYLLEDHDALITIGGLGPTSDDRTRYGLADAVKRPLEFNEEVWQWIVDMLQSKGLAVPETNRQQALLPKNSKAIYNANGTAAACYFQYDQKDIFMLPGPPNECRPIFHDTVLPMLLEKGYGEKEYRKSWLLIGVSESDIADQLENLMPDSNCILGFRVHFPYLEVKLRSYDLPSLKKLSKKFTEKIKPKLISESNQTASEQLQHYLTHANKDLLIMDEATYGVLETKLRSPDTRKSIYFYHRKPKFEAKPIEVKITGLDAYWKKSKDESKKMPICIHISTDDNVYTIEKHIYNRGEQSLDSAAEVICWELLKYL